MPGEFPFDEAVSFFRQKVNVPSERWADIWAGAHARAFTVAGAVKDELLVDFRTAVDKAIADGVSLQDFRKDFDSIVQRHGWSYKGSRGWRSRVIYETNLRTAYAAGRWEQMTDPELLKVRPYLRYAHGDSRRPRPEHLAWDGLILRHDDPWWDTHAPPNGWGCSCRVFSAGKRDLKRRGKSGPDTAPDGGSYEWTDKVTGETKTVPKGIDPGWDYNVGHANAGKAVPPEVARKWAAAEDSGWEPMSGQGDWQTAGRPAKLPLHKPVTSLSDVPKDRSGMVSAVRQALGDVDERVFSTAGDVAITTHVHAGVLGEHLAADLPRGRFLPLLPDLLENPEEVWASFERHRGSGRVRLRVRYVKSVRAGTPKSLVMVADAQQGELVGWTFFPSKGAYVNKLRQGKLVLPRE